LSLLERANLNHWLALSTGHNRVNISLPPPENGKRCSFRNIVFSSYFEFRAMGKVKKPSGSECYTPSRDHFRFHITVFVSDNIQVVTITFISTIYRMGRGEKYPFNVISRDVSVYKDIPMT
jgi:hypothetical protein